MHHFQSMPPPSKASVLHVEARRHLDIIDIRRGELEINLKEDILSSFSPEDGPRTLPTLLLYDDKGLQLFEEVRLKAHLQAANCCPARPVFASRPILFALLTTTCDCRSHSWRNTT